MNWGRSSRKAWNGSLGSVGLVNLVNLVNRRQKVNTSTFTRNKGEGGKQLTQRNATQRKLIEQSTYGQYVLNSTTRGNERIVASVLRLKTFYFLVYSIVPDVRLQ